MNSALSFWPFANNDFRSAYGKFSARQAAAARPYLKGRVVHDLGCGDGFPLARAILRYGAKKVYGVDSRPLFPGTKLPAKAKAEYVCESLSQYVPDDLDVAFLSWPVNHEVGGLVSLVKRAPVVVYLGKNFDGTVCGTRELYLHFVRRELLVHVPHKQNTLLVLGGLTKRPRHPTPEEQAGINRDGPIFAFEDAYGSAKRS